MLRRLWDGFSKMMMAFGHFMSRNVVTPTLFAVLGLLFTGPARIGDPLRLKRRAGSVWEARPTRAESLEQARSLH